MALDRTWYNTLVDDDGSNTVGTVWNKASVDALMDATDTEIIRLNGGLITYAPYVYTAENAACWHGGTLLAGSYCIMGRLVFWTMYLQNLNVPAQTAYLQCEFPAAAPRSHPDAYLTCNLRVHTAAGNGLGYGNMSSGGFLYAYRPDGPIPLGVTHVMGQGWYYF